MNLWNIGAGIVEFLLTVCASVAIVLLSMEKWIGPRLVSQIGDELKGQFEVAEAATRQGMSAMGKKSATMAQVSQVEGMLVDGVLDQYPELQMMIENLNPELYESIMEKIKERPEIVQILWQRWGHFLDKGAVTDEKRDRGGTKYPRV